MHMLKPVLLVCGLISVLHGAAQNVLNDSTAAVIAYWEPGDQRSYRVERTKTGPRAARSTYTMALRVLDATDSTYQLECIFRDLVVEAELPEDPRDRAVFQKLLNASNGLRIVCTTDETGVPTALANQSEVQEHARQVLLSILDMALSPNERLQMRAALEPVLDDDVLAQDALEDLGNLLFPFGVAYITGRKEEVQAEVPNPLGGVPFGTQQIFTMTRLDTTAHTATMRMEQHIDPKAVDDEIEDLIDSSGGKHLAGEARERIRRTIEGIAINETMDIEVDLNGAWTTELRFVRETVLQGERERESRHYTLRTK